MGDAAISTPRPLRADAQRSYQQILEAAKIVIAVQGTKASLEEIARRACVGSATLHRHFKSRRILFEAVFHDQIEALCQQAQNSSCPNEPAPALFEWLRAVAEYGSTVRGLSATLLPHGLGDDSENTSRCAVLLAQAGQTLLSRAQDMGEVSQDVEIADLLFLVNAITFITEQENGIAVELQQRRLLLLMFNGVLSTGHLRFSSEVAPRVR